MSESQLCHWLLFEPNGKCKSIFAKEGDSVDGYTRVGQAVTSSQFVIPLVFAVKAVPSEVCERVVRLKFCLCRDDKNQPGPAFAGMASLKVATLVSELSVAITEWVEAADGRLEAMRLLEDPQNSFELEFDTQVDKAIMRLRCTEIIKAGVEMMAFCRGLSVSWLATH